MFEISYPAVFVRLFYTGIYNLAENCASVTPDPIEDVDAPPEKNAIRRGRKYEKAPEVRSDALVFSKQITKSLEYSVCGRCVLAIGFIDTYPQ